MKHYKNILSFIISLILMFSLILSIFLIFFKSTLVNDIYYRDILTKNDTTNKINESIYKDINYILLTNNIPQSISKDIISLSEIEDYSNRSISDLLNFFLGKKEEIPALDISVYMDRLNLGINSYIKDNNVGLTKGTSEVFNQLKTSSKEIISTELEVIDYSALSKSETGLKLRKIATILDDSKILFGLIIVDVILCISLIVLWRKRKHRGCAWIGYSFVSSGLLVGIVSYSGIISKFYENAAVPAGHLKENISLIIEGYFIKLSTISIICFIVGVLFMIVNWRHLYKRYMIQQKQGLNNLED